MKLHKIVIAVIAFVFVLAASAPAVLAGADEPGLLASCEMASPKGIPILGTAAVSIDPNLFGLVSVSFQMLAIESGVRFVVIRALVGPDLGQSPMQIICDILNGDTVEGGDTLAQQILANVNLTRRQLMITKRSIFGCDALPCANPGRRPDFALIPGSDIATALGDVILFAVKP
jgi:hypothetical protein